MVCQPHLGVFGAHTMPGISHSMGLGGQSVFCHDCHPGETRHCLGHSTEGAPRPQRGHPPEVPQRPPQPQGVSQRLCLSSPQPGSQPKCGVSVHFVHRPQGIQHPRSPRKTNQRRCGCRDGLHWVVRPFRKRPPSGDEQARRLGFELRLGHCRDNRHYQDPSRASDSSEHAVHDACRLSSPR